MAQSYYELLGVPATASSEEIEAAFRSRASEVHPDRVSGHGEYLKGVAAEAFKNLSEAKAVLTDPGKRQRYDTELARSRGSAGRGRAKVAAVGASAASYAAADAKRRPSKRAAYARLALAIFAVAAALVLAGLLWTNLSSSPSMTAPVEATPASASSSTRPRASQSSSNAAQKTKGGSSTDGTRASTSSTSAPNTLTLWRASQPPDLSGLSSADRLNIESACSYAKLEPQDEYNGCLAHQLAIHGTTPSPPDLSALPVHQREAIESACATVNLMQGPAAYNQCLAHQLELANRNASAR